MNRKREELVKLIRLFYIFIAFHPSLSLPQHLFIILYYFAANVNCPQASVKKKMLNEKRNRTSTWRKTLINIFMLMIYRENGIREKSKISEKITLGGFIYNFWIKLVKFCKKTNWLWWYIVEIWNKNLN